MTTTQKNEIPEMISVKTLAERLGVSEATIRRREQDGSLVSFRLGGIGAPRFDWVQILNDPRNHRRMGSVK